MLCLRTDRLRKNLHNERCHVKKPPRSLHPRGLRHIWKTHSRTFVLQHSPNIVTSQHTFHSTKSTVPNCLISWTNEISWFWEKMPRVTLMSSDCQKCPSPMFNNFKTISKLVAHKELPQKTQPTANPLDPMLSYRYHWKTEKKDSEKSTSSISLVIKEAPIIWTWKNKRKSMASKSISLSFSWRSVLEDLIKERITFHSEALNLQCALKIPSSDFVELSWLATYHPLPEVLRIH